MISALLAFAVLFLALFVGIRGFCHMTGRDQVELIKIFVYSMICCMLAVVILTAIVVIF
jgi:hypothetical protein